MRKSYSVFVCDTCGREGENHAWTVDVTHMVKGGANITKDVCPLCAMSVDNFMDTLRKETVYGDEVNAEQRFKKAAAEYLEQRGWTVSAPSLASEAPPGPRRVG